MKQDYQDHGFVVVRNFFDAQELDLLEPILLKFHEQWMKDNQEFYQTKAVNSAYLTHIKSLNAQDRLTLFQFIASTKMNQLLSELIPEDPSFMNTQLFFDPLNPGQKNYWHRDIQYSGMSDEAQAEMMKQINVLHFRVPLKKENGMELVPGSHKRWDTDVEYDIRNAQNGHHVFDALPDAEHVALDRGDLLVFSANMLHRGIYGLSRMTLDILFCDSNPELLGGANPECFPNEAEGKSIPHPHVFSNALRAME